MVSSAFAYDPAIDLSCGSTEKCNSGFTDIGLGVFVAGILAITYWLISQSNLKAQHHGDINMGSGTNEVKEGRSVGLSQLKDYGLLYASDFKLKIFCPTRSGELYYSLGTGWGSISSFDWSNWFKIHLAALKYESLDEFQFGQDTSLRKIKNCSSNSTNSLLLRCDPVGNRT